MDSILIYANNTIKSTDPTFWLIAFCFYMFMIAFDTFQREYELKNEEEMSVSSVRFDVTRDLLIEIRNELEKVRYATHSLRRGSITSSNCCELD